MRMQKWLFVASSLVGFSVLGMGCSGNGGEGVGSSSAGITTSYGVDYSFARPSPASLRAQGYKFAARYLSYVRSEERRVGKECRSRWSPYH